ncbi:MAG: hypothetical protein C0501_08715 [Isosphaera sp.]|nr:hypothetical protein [Isosphaera sp.]
MNPRRHLELARSLVAGVRQGAPASPGAGEAECRCAIGRAYYAAFLVARDFLNRIGVWVTPTAAAHPAVRFALNNSGVAALGAVAAQLDALSTDRQYADYEPDDPRTETADAAEAGLNSAATAIRMLDLIAAGRVHPPVDLPAVAAAILAWAKANGQDAKIRRA